MKALIVGGGIGGLTAALCLLRAGWQVKVFEQAPSVEPVGAGIQLSPNAVRVLRTMGLFNEVRAASFAPERLEMRLGRDGRQVFSIELARAAESRWGAPYLHIHRAALINCLVSQLHKLAPGALRTTSHVVKYHTLFEAANSNSRQLASARSVDPLKTEPMLSDLGHSQSDAICIELSNGERISGDLLIGADGIHSTVRDQMLSKQPLKFTGNVAYRAVVPVDRLGAHAPAPNACVWVGAGKHAVTYRLGKGNLANFVGVVEQDDWREESWTQACESKQPLTHFHDWHPVVTTLIEQADEHHCWALFDREVLSQWSDQRVVLLGDACHPMLPFLAQGGCMAIEDAWVLAHQLANVEGERAHLPIALPDALQKYSQIRQPRVRQVKAIAQRNRRNFHMRPSMARTMAHSVLRQTARFAPSRIHANLDWLYGFDVAAAKKNNDIK